MFDVTIDTSEVTRAWAAEVRNIERGAEMAVEIAGKAGEDIARATAPTRTYALRDSIRFRLDRTGARGASGVLRADAKHASYMRDGTRSHVIEARRRRALRWEGPDGIRFARRVLHPGTQPHPFWELALQTVELRLVRAGENVADGVAARMSR